MRGLAASWKLEKGGEMEELREHIPSFCSRSSCARRRPSRNSVCFASKAAAVPGTMSPRAGILVKRAGAWLNGRPREAGKSTEGDEGFAARAMALRASMMIRDKRWRAMVLKKWRSEVGGGVARRGVGEGSDVRLQLAGGSLQGSQLNGD